MRNKKGQYVKGNISWSKINKGLYKTIPCSDETKEKISQANTGKIRTEETRIKISQNNARFWLGKKRKPHTLEARLKISAGLKGRPAWNKGLIGWRAGEIHSWMPHGEAHWSYKKDRSTLVKRQIRGDSAYREWRKLVTERDKNICQLKDENCRGYMIAAHIKGWALYPELRYEVNNGIILCQRHHPKTRSEDQRLMPVFQELVGSVNLFA